MKKTSTFVALLLVAMSAMADGRMKLTYTVTPDTVGHYLDVDLTCEDALWTEGGQPKPFTLKMPVWAPGYYLIVDFPKYLTDFSASDTSGHGLAWTKQGKNAWVVTPADKLTHVKYRIFANERSVAECRVEDQMAFVAPNGVFMYVDGEKSSSVTVTYKMPGNWKHISTGLKRVGQDTFVASDADVLYDSPVLMGNHHVETFSLEGHEYEIALETPDGVEQTHFIDDFKKMVCATTRLMRHVPYDNYCLIHLGKGQGGLEHHNSQACYTDGTFRFASDEQYKSYMSFTTHEYFHLYNVKSIRPVELGPFDYDHEVYTPMLWVSEGFTVYYETRIMLDAGIVDADYVLGDLSSYIATIEGNEGHRHMSLRQSSYDIWLNFFNRAANGRDVRISYYDKGPILGLLFDIELRSATGGKKTLDDLMRLLYDRFYIDMQRGFTEKEFWAAAEEVAGASLATLRRYVDTTDEIDYDAILSCAGIQLDRSTWRLGWMEHPDKAQLKLRRQMWGK